VRPQPEGKPNQPPTLPVTQSVRLPSHVYILPCSVALD
jgi:hypothetical protein